MFAAFFVDGDDECFLPVCGDDASVDGCLIKDSERVCEFVCACFEKFSGYSVWSCGFMFLYRLEELEDTLSGDLNVGEYCMCYIGGGGAVLSFLVWV